MHVAIVDVFLLPAVFGVKKEKTKIKEKKEEDRDPALEIVSLALQ